MCGFRGDMFAESDVSILSDMSEYKHVRNRNMRGLEHLSWFVHLPRRGHVSAAADL